MDNKEIQRLTEAIKSHSKTMEKLVNLLDKQNQKIDSLTMAISELKTTLKGNPNA